MEALKNEEMYVLVAPDGNPQPMTMGPDFETCVSVCTMLELVGLSTPLKRLFADGFKILPVLVTIVPNGDEDKQFAGQKRISATYEPRRS